MTSGERGEPSLPKLVAERIGRLFNLVFNRVTMYTHDHPTTQESIRQLGETVSEGLHHLSPLTIILDRDNLYIEDEPLDPRVNAQRLVMHMKKAGVQSISFGRGCSDPDIEEFARVFGDPKKYTSADAMKKALQHQGIQRIRINHVFFKKMTADEEIVEKAAGPSGVTGGVSEIVIDSTTASRANAKPTEVKTGSPPQEAPPGDLFPELTPSVLLENPAMISKQLLEAIHEGPGNSGVQSTGENAFVQGIRELRHRVEEVGRSSKATSSSEELVGAVYRLKEQVRDGIESRKKRGEPVPDEDVISGEMDELTDQVMIQLVREEYQKGQITVKRLAQILRRMMPDERELRRLLPKLKEVLLSEGMPLADYLQLIRELERELQSDELSLALERGAEEVGLSVDDFIREIREDPGGAANLIVLASEIRCLGGREKPELLSQILVDYVEKVGKELAFERARMDGPNGVKNLRSIVSQVQEELVGQLQSHLEGSPVAEHMVKAFQSDQRDLPVDDQRDFILQQFAQGNKLSSDPQAMLEAVEHAYPDPAKQEKVLESIVHGLEDRGLDAEPLLSLLAKKVGMAPGENDPEKAPRGTFNRTIILFFLREEFKRAKRYGHMFSTLLIGIRKAKAEKPIPIGMIRPHEVRNVLMLQLKKSLREVDLIGCFKEDKILILLPFTDADGAAAVYSKVIEKMDGKTFEVRNVPMHVKLMVAFKSFDREQSPTLKIMVSRLEQSLSSN